MSSPATEANALEQELKQVNDQLAAVDTGEAALKSRIQELKFSIGAILGYTREAGDDGAVFEPGSVQNVEKSIAELESQRAAMKGFAANADKLIDELKFHPSRLSAIEVDDHAFLADLVRISKAIKAVEYYRSCAAVKLDAIDEQIAQRKKTVRMLEDSAKQLQTELDEARAKLSSLTFARGVGVDGWLAATASAVMGALTSEEDDDEQPRSGTASRSTFRRS